MNNFVGKLRGEYRVIKNINDYKFHQKQDDKIYLFQQFYIPKSQERYDETKYCLRRNVECEEIIKIYLLNERIYTSEEMGFKEMPSKIVQVNLGKRLTFYEAFRFSSYLKGFLVFSNSDIFFDETLENVKYMGLEKRKSVECLCRYEYRGEKNIKKCLVNYNHVNSFDTWIIHSSHMNYGKEYDFWFGLSGCDVHISYLFDKNGYLILNDNKEIRSYHNHRQISREYYSEQEEIKPPWYLIYRDDFIGTSMPILLKYCLNWIYFDTTELEFVKKNWKDKNCFSLPWKYVKPSTDLIRDIRMIVKRNKTYTCFQRRSFTDFVEFFKAINITEIYTPYKKKEQDDIRGIKIISIPSQSMSLITDGEGIFNKGHKKDILYSYVGDNKSKIKQKLFSIDPGENSVFIKIEYSNPDDIYDHSNGDAFVRTDEYKSKINKYKEIMTRSNFVICTDNNMIKFWDVIYTGSVPVLIWDEIELPSYPDWVGAILRIKEEDIDKVDMLIRGKEGEWENMLQECKKIADFFKM